MLACLACLACLGGLVPIGCRTPAPEPWDGRLSEADQARADALAHYAQGLIHQAEEGRGSPKTLHAYQRAAELDPRSYRVQVQLAMAYWARGQSGAALRTLETYCEDNPRHADAWLDLAVLAQEREQMDLALRAWRAVAELRPSDPQPRGALIVLLFQQEQDDEALARLAEGMGAEAPDRDRFIELGYRQAWFFLSDKQYARALACFERVAAAVAPERLPASFYLQHGATCERMEKFDRAEQIFQQGLAFYPDTHEILNYLAYMWAEQAVHLDEAKALATRALAMEPDNGAYVDTLGWIYYRQGRYQDALAELKRAHELLPDDPVVADHVGDVYYALSRRDEALRYWKKSYRLDPDDAAVAAKLSEQDVEPEAEAEGPDG